MKNKKITIISIILLVIIFVIVSFFSYFKNYIDLDYAGILYTFSNNTTGTSKDVIKSVFVHILPYLVITLVFIAFIVYFNAINKKSFDIIVFNKKLDGKKLTTKLIVIISILFIVVTSIMIDKYFYISKYYEMKNKQTHIYDDYFVDPNKTTIDISNKHNLILIYLESMETSFMSEDRGGFLEYNLIPHLEELAKNNVNFSFDNNVGGFNTTIGSSWTMGSLFASTCGIPFSFPINGNVSSTQKDFSNKVTALGDILHKNGYYQEFLCGSDSTFGGRSYYYENHQYDKIYDYYTALDKKVVNDFVWWGFDDSTLYDIAKQELIELSKKDQPFNLTMLTVDTHHVGGYVCNKCKTKYDIQYANVIKCADEQINEFVAWVKEQDFYDKTTIVIIGDHPTMDVTLIDGNINNSDKMYRRYDSSDYDTDNRFVYNCFINSACVPVNEKNRGFNTLDLFPTILASIGFNINDNRLGLGTNLFADKKTLQEEHNYQYIQEELTKYSQFYADNFYNNK